MVYMITRHGWCFLTCSVPIGIDDKEWIACQAVDMYRKGESRRRVVGESYEGIIRTEGKYQTLDALTGQRFDVDIETIRGRGKMAFLISEQTKLPGGYSRN